MTDQPRLIRGYDLHHPEDLRVEFHEPGCPCFFCALHRQDDPSPEPALSFGQIGALVWLGLAIGTAIAFAIDPHGAWLALTTVFTGGR